jgi:hypothetical protein
MQKILDTGVLSEVPARRLAEGKQRVARPGIRG